MPTTNTLHVAMAYQDSDGTYSNNAIITLISLLENNRANSLMIWIVAPNITPHNYTKLEQLIARYNQRGKIISNISESNMQLLELIEERTLKKNNQIFKGCGLVLLLHTIIDPLIDTVLYLDCDLIVERDISEVCRTHSKAAVAGAVDAGAINSNHVSEVSAHYQVNILNYINTGVLVMNLEKLRKIKFEEKISEFLVNIDKKMTFPDQDIINVLLVNDIDIIEPINNLQIISITNRTPIHNAIIHYSGTTKRLIDAKSFLFKVHKRVTAIYKKYSALGQCTPSQYCVTRSSIAREIRIRKIAYFMTPWRTLTTLEKVWARVLKIYTLVRYQQNHKRIL